MPKQKIDEVISFIEDEDIKADKKWAKFLDKVISSLRSVEHPGAVIKEPTAYHHKNSESCIIRLFMAGCLLGEGALVTPKDVADAVERMRASGSPMDRIRFRKDLADFLWHLFVSGSRKGKSK